MLKFTFLLSILLVSNLSYANTCSKFIGNIMDLNIPFLKESHNFVDPSLRFSVESQSSKNTTILKETNLELPTAINQTPLLKTLRKVYDPNLELILDATASTGSFFSLMQPGVLGYLKVASNNSKIKFLFWEGQGNKIEKLVKVDGELLAVKQVTGKASGTKPQNLEQYDHLIFTFKEATTGATTTVKIPSAFVNPIFKTVSAPKATESQDGTLTYSGYHWGLLFGVE